jgi:hypothetical protein
MSGPHPDQLRRALRELAEADVEEVVAFAREQARARAQKLIEDAMLDELLEAVARRSTGAAATRREGQPAEDQTAEAWWVYCVLAARDCANVPSGLEGIESGMPVQTLREGELAAVVSPLPAAEYDDDRLREHLEDLEWVERTARRHESVLEGALDRVAIVPLRLCTIYHDLAGVRRLLRERATVLTTGLAKVDGCAEWGVKVFAGEVGPGDVEPHRSAAIAEGERPGATYLLHRQRERQQAARASELRAACVQSVHERASLCAREAVANSPQRPELHGRGMAMILNGAYLVSHDRVQGLHDAVAALQATWAPQGFVIELTGPWPAYNFVSETAGMVP